MSSLVSLNMFCLGVYSEYYIHSYQVKLDLKNCNKSANRYKQFAEPLCVCVYVCVCVCVCVCVGVCTLSDFTKFSGYTFGKGLRPV